jgi:hypothetical protein
MSRPVLAHQHNLAVGRDGDDRNRVSVGKEIPLSPLPVRKKVVARHHFDVARRSGPLMHEFPWLHGRDLPT